LGNKVTEVFCKQKAGRGRGRGREIFKLMERDVKGEKKRREAPNL
jgi:hypothetical protein